jgi:hypothetical protein
MSIKLATDSETADGIRARNKSEVERSARDLRFAARALASNLMRIAAGAGKPHNIIGEVADLYASYRSLYPFSGTEFYPYAPHAPITEGLQDFDWRDGNASYSRPTNEDLDRWANDGTLARARALGQIADCALRWRAAQLAAQPTQETVAERNLTYAARAYVALKR